MAHKLTKHRDGSLTYWSVSGRAWRKRCYSIGPEDLQSLPVALREKVISWADRHGWIPTTTGGLRCPTRPRPQPRSIPKYPDLGGEPPYPIW